MKVKWFFLMHFIFLEISSQSIFGCEVADNQKKYAVSDP